MEGNKEQFSGGLIFNTEDEIKEDYSLGSVFGTIDISKIPHEDFMTTFPIDIKNQGRTDLCTAYALASVNEDQEEVKLDPNFLFSEIKRKRGEYKQWGGDLKSGCKVAVKVGAIESEESPLYWENAGRDFVANWLNWDKFPELQEKAKEHKKLSYFKVDGRYTTFDNIRVALWQHLTEKRSLYTGCMWQSSWNYAKNGIVPNKLTNKGIGHAFKIFGQKIINGEPYIMVQNSYGDRIGDKGVFYFSKYMVNKYFKFRVYMFKDMPVEVAKDLNEKALTGIRYTSNSWLNKWWKFVTTLLSRPK